MKVFLSWSGQVSFQVAAALEKWLPCVIQSLEPFLSSNISKGDRWSDALADELKEASYGIICVTPYNIHSPWMNFEAGALAKTIGQACVWPFLFHAQPEDIAGGPLSQFQATIFEKADVLSLIRSINARLKEPLRKDLLDRTFEKWWEELDKALDQISPTQNETRAYYDWLYTQADLDLYLPNAEFSTVWVVTLDAGRYLAQDMREKVAAASKANKKFRYFLPFDDDYQADIKRLKEACPANLELKVFPTAEFESQVASDYVIFNPDGEGDLKVLVRLPLGGHPTGEYWFRTSDHSARNFVSRFRKLWEGPESSSMSPTEKKQASSA